MVVPSDWAEQNELIKVIGVGGGGVNAVTYMYYQKIQGCTFIVCNTDSQSLEESAVPMKIQLGAGRGAGTDPTKGRNFALEAQDEISTKVLGDKTEMLFITAGMGGGTGTGAAPVIAKMAHDKKILTVAVVTLPSKNDQSGSMTRAIDGIHELQQNVDSLLLINNEKIYEYFGDMLIQEAFPKTDEILATAVRAVVGLISTKGYMNVDFEAVEKMMHARGVAMLGCGSGSGPNRIQDAIKQALESPLLNDCDLKTAKHTLINITAGYNKDGLSVKELEQINDSIKEYTGNADRFKTGIVYDRSPEFGDKVNITIIATGFKISTLEKITDVSLGNLIYIEPDFEYSKAKMNTEGGEIKLDNVDVHKIGASVTYNVPRFKFDEDNVPVLVSSKKAISQLENEPAIARRTILS